jgi:hypothetical protein
MTSVKETSLAAVDPVECTTTMLDFLAEMNSRMISSVTGHTWSVGDTIAEAATISGGAEIDSIPREVAEYTTEVSAMSLVILEDPHSKICSEETPSTLPDSNAGPLAPALTSFKIFSMELNRISIRSADDRHVFSMGYIRAVKYVMHIM